MAIQFSQPTVTAQGYLRYTLTLDSNIQGLSKNDFTVVFNGTVGGQRRVDQVLPNDPFQLSGTGTTRTFTVVPPTDAIGNIIVYYTPDNEVWGEPNVDASDPFDIHTAVGGSPDPDQQSGGAGGQSGGVSGQQSGSTGCHGTDAYVFVYYKNSSTPITSAPNVTYCVTTNRFRVTTSGWSSSYSPPLDCEQTYISFIRVRVGYCGPDRSNRCSSRSCATATVPAVIPRGCPGTDGDDGTDGRLGSDQRVYIFYKKALDSAAAPTATSGNFLRLSSGVYGAGIPGWSSTVPSLEACETLYYVLATGTIRYTSSCTNSDRSDGLSIGCVIKVPKGCPGSRGCPGNRGSTSQTYIFYKKRLDTQSAPPQPTSGRYRKNSSHSYTPLITNWSTTRPTLASNETLYYLIATGTIYYTSHLLTSDVSGGLSIGCVIKVEKGCPGEDGDAGCRGSEERQYVFYRASSSELSGSPRGVFTKNSRTGVFTASITSQSGWTQTVPNVSSTQDLYYVNAWGTINYNRSGVSSSGGLRIGCIVKVVSGIDGTDGTDGDDGCRGSERRPYVFYRASSSELSGSPRGVFTKNSRTGVFTASITSQSGWTQTVPTLSTGQDLYYLNAWGIVNYNRSGVSSSGGLVTSCIIKVPRGCKGDPGCRSQEQRAYIFYKKVTRGTTVSQPNGATDGSYTRVRAGVYTPAISGGWSQCPPSNVADNEDLYYVNAWGHILYDANGTDRSGGLSIGCIVKELRGAQGECGDPGDDGDCGRRGSEQRQYIFYRKARTGTTITPPTSGTFSKVSTGNYRAQITNWSQTLPTVSANEDLYYVNAWGTINYSTYESDSDFSGGLGIGCMVKVPKGPVGCRGSERRPYVFYRKARSTVTVNPPTSGTFRKSGSNYIAEITNWSQCAPSLSTGEVLYYVNAWGTINYNAAGVGSAVAALEIGCMIQVQTGRPGTPGACGTKLQQFRKYARATNAPSTAGISYNSSGNLVLTPAANQIWSDSIGSGSLKVWFIDIYGYRNYAQDGTVTPSHCIFGPFEVGSEGPRGKCGDTVVVKSYYQAKTGTAPDVPTTATFNGTNFIGMGAWTLSPPLSIADPANLYVMTAYGYTRYDDDNNAVYSVDFSCPYIVPRGCQGDQGDAADPPARVFVTTIYTRSSTVPNVATGFTINANGSFSYPSNWEANFADLTGNLQPYELTLVGTVTYPNSVATPQNPPCKFGPVPVGSKGVKGDQGVHGINNFTDVYYRRVTTGSCAPASPSSVTRTSIVRDAPTNWQSTLPTIDPAYDIYYTIANTAVTYRSCDTNCVASAVTTYSCPIPILRGTKGDKGDIGPCGATVRLKILYIRNATVPDVDTISFNPDSASADADGFVYPSGWGVTIPAGTANAWQITIVGYINYSNDGTATYTHAIFGPVTVGARGNPGTPGCSAFPRQFFQRAALAAAPAKPTDAEYTSIAPPTGWSSTISDATDATNMSLPLFLLYASFEGCTGYGCVKYSDPVPIPPGSEGCDGTSSRIALVYRRSTSVPTVPTFDPDDTSTGTWNGTTFIPSTNWSLSEPSGTNQLYMMSAELRSDNTIVYGTIVPIPTGTGSGGSVAEKAPDVRIDRTDRIYEADGTTLIPTSRVICPPGVVQTPTLGITFLWSEIVSGFATSDVTVRTYSDDNNRVTLTWPDSRSSSGQSWNATLNFPANSSGEAQVIVKKDSVQSQVVGSGSGPAVDRSYSVSYNVAGVDTTPPSLCIRYSAQLRRLYFYWSEPVNGFRADDITLSSNPNITKGTLIGDCYRRTYSMDLAVPAHTSDISLTIIVRSAAVTDDAGNENFRSTSTITISPSQTAASVPAGTTQLAIIDNTFATLDWLDPVVNRDPAGGAFQGVSDLIKVGDYLYGVAQIIHRHESDGTRLQTSQEAGAAVFRINVNTRDVSVVKAYTHITQAARSLTEYRNNTYWFEGSGYLYSGFAEGHDADGVVGNVISHNNCGSYDHGLNFRSILGRSELAGFNAHYGRHGATMSPMRVKDGQLLLISGFGNFWHTESADDEVSALENWQLIRYHNQINTRLPAIQTNERTGWDVVSELARITNSIVGFDQGDIVFKSRNALTATLSSALTNNGTTTTYTNGLAPLKNSGIFLIDDELIEYSFEED